MYKILFYSNNLNKLNEIKNFFDSLKFKIYSPIDFNISYEPKEFGKSFAENAKIKSSYGFHKLNMPCFADDSGFCVEALNWKPGILSKDFINSFSKSDQCFKHIIKKVEISKKTRAYFKTSICLTLKDNYHIIFEGKVDGTISKIARGINGFGYDPIFIPHGYSKTFGEMNHKQKNKLSHRSIAIQKLINFLSN